MTAAPRIDSYEWRGGREAMLRWGPEDGPVMVVALPLFEEANRTRAFAASLCRALAGLGVGSVLLDLPGQGESLVATEHATLDDLRAAFAAVPASHAVAIRSGALLVDVARPCWLLAPQTGPELLRELARVKGGALEGERVEVGGHVLGRALLDQLGQAHHSGEGRDPVSAQVEESTILANGSRLDPGLRRGGACIRTARLASDSRPADRKVDGPALWRRAEPGNDPVLVQTLAADIADWVSACEG